MKKLIFLSGHLPVERSRQAGHKTAFRNLVWLADQYDVHLLSFRAEVDRDEPISELKRLCSRVKVIDVDRSSRVRGVLVCPHLPLAVAARWSSEALACLREWTRDTAIHRVHCEWSQMAQYTPAFQKIPIRSLHILDVLRQWAERKAASRGAIQWRLEAWRTRHWERSHYPRLTHLYVPSAKDRALILEDIPEVSGRIRVVQLQFDNYRPLQPRDYSPPIKLLFWGAFGRRENAEAARWLGRKVVPLLQSRSIPFKLILAGSNPPEDVLQLASKDIEVTGFVPDPAPIFGAAQLAVLPLFEGAGLKVKVVECLLAGLPVLTTSVGAEGIEAGPADGMMTLSDDPEAFVREIERFSKNPASLEGLGGAAIRWIERHKKDEREAILSEGHSS